MWQSWMIYSYYEFARKFIRYCRKAKYNPKSFFKKLELKALRLTYEQQLPECISLPQTDKSATDKAPQRNGRQNHYPKEFITPG